MAYVIRSRINAGAVKFDQLDYIDVLNRNLGVMDSTATSLCMDNRIPIIVFDFNEPNSIVRIVRVNRSEHSWGNRMVEEILKDGSQDETSDCLDNQHFRHNPYRQGQSEVDPIIVMQHADTLVLASVSAQNPMLLISLGTDCRKRYRKRQSWHRSRLDTEQRR